MISFVIPAHNEQAGLGRTLQAIHDAARVVGGPYEIIVVDDASTDATAEIARQHQATVLPVHHRQIAATRNSGGRAAQGDRLFFVDADTTINARVVTEALRYMDKGVVGGGSPVLFSGIVPLYIRLMAFFGIFVTKLAGFTGGAFMFCTRAAFTAAGGFDERFYWAEEVVFILSLKRQGHFVVLWKPVLTSPRRFRTLSGRQLPVFVAGIFRAPFKAFTRRASVQKIWYDSNRAGDDIISDSPVAKVTYAIALLTVLVVITGPIWYFIPWSLTPWGSPLGIMRFVIETFLCHLGLICWPFAVVLCAQLFRRTYWVEWTKLAALMVVFFWLAWNSTQGVIWSWSWLGHKLAHIYRS